LAADCPLQKLAALRLPINPLTFFALAPLRLSLLIPLWHKGFRGFQQFDEFS
jgi:hypothetical protein